MENVIPYQNACHSFPALPLFPPFSTGPFRLPDLSPTNPFCHLHSSPSRSDNGRGRTRRAREQKEIMQPVLLTQATQGKGLCMAALPRRGSHTSCWYKPISKSIKLRTPALPQNTPNPGQGTTVPKLWLTTASTNPLTEDLQANQLSELKNTFFQGQ